MNLSVKKGQSQVISHADGTETEVKNTLFLSFFQGHLQWQMLRAIKRWFDILGNKCIHFQAKK